MALWSSVKWLSSLASSPNLRSIFWQRCYLCTALLNCKTSWSQFIIWIKMNRISKMGNSNSSRQEKMEQQSRKKKRKVRDWMVISSSKMIFLMGNNKKTQKMLVARVNKIDPPCANHSFKIISMISSNLILWAL